MPTIDAQVHAYERDYPGRPWAGVLRGPPQVTGDDMVAAMDAVGVDGALLVSPFSMYRYDASYALAVHAAHPGRFGLIKPVDPADPAVADTIAEWAATKGTVGIRIMLNREGVSTDAADPGLNRVLATAARHSLPVNLICNSRTSRLRPKSRLPICGGCWPWRPTTTSRSRSPAPARCRTSHSPTMICGIRSAASSTRSASIAACGAPTGPGPWRC
jgi:hypothetical protein